MILQTLPLSGQAGGSALLGSGHSSCILGQGVCLQFVLEKVPPRQPGLSGKSKRGFLEMKLQPVAEFTFVTAPVQGGTWTRFLCGRWKIPTVYVRKGVTHRHKPFHLVFSEGLGQAGQSPGSPSTGHIVTMQRPQQAGPDA